MWTTQEVKDGLHLLIPPSSTNPTFVTLGPMPWEQAELMRNWLNALEERWKEYQHEVHPPSRLRRRASRR